MSWTFPEKPCNDTKATINVTIFLNKYILFTAKVSRDIGKNVHMLLDILHLVYTWICEPFTYSAAYKLRTLFVGNKGPLKAFD